MFESYDYANNEAQNRYCLAHVADGPEAEMAIQYLPDAAARALVITSVEALLQHSVDRGLRGRIASHPIGFGEMIEGVPHGGRTEHASMADAPGSRPPRRQ